MSLYLKYRPQDFASVVGQAYIKKTLQNALRHKALSHAYLFCGPRGTGKTSMARIVAKALNCEASADAEPCNNCDICVSVNTGRLVDLIEIDAASNRGIDEIRELREKIVFSPTQAKSKVYIVDEVHMLTKEAFNALLKTLEEPPSHAYFILATTEAHKIPETIVSRCQQFSFGRIENADISQRLQEVAEAEGVIYEKDALDMIAKLSGGGLRDAIGLLEQMMAAGEINAERVADDLGLIGESHLKKFFHYLLEKKPLKAIELLNQIKSKGKSMSQFLKEVMAVFREEMLIRLGNSDDTRTILGFIDIFTEAGRLADFSPIPELPLEMAIIKACDYTVEAADASPSEPILTAIREKQAAPVATVAPDTELTFESIKKNWPRALDAISTPFVRMSLADGEPVSYSQGKLTVAFKSSSFMEKVSSTPNQAVIQESFMKVFGSTLDLVLQMKKIELNPVIKALDENDRKPYGAAEMAAEVFGIN